MMEKVQLRIDEMNNYFVNESFKTLRTNLQFCGSDNKVIAVTSCDASEGKTTVALMLAKSLSELNKKVIFIDCDLRKSVVETKYADTKNANGMSEFLAGLVKKEDVIYSTQYDNLDIIFSGPFCSNPVELMMGDAFVGLLKELREKYDYVIVDTPPLGLVIDSAVVAKNCDGAIMVISAGRIRYKQAKKTKEQLEKSGCKILGAVLNHVEKRGERYYKRYHKRYYGKGYYSNYLPQEN